MNLVHTEEQNALEKILRDLLDHASPPERVAEIADGDSDYDEALWGRLAHELGITGLLVPERHGGAGATWREVAAVVGELGRSLACVPYVSSSVVAVTALLQASDDDLAADLLPAIAAGERIATVAMADATGSVSHEGVAATAKATGTDTWQLRGTVPFVPDGTVADTVLVLADSDQGLTWFVVDRGAKGVHLEPMEVMDATRPIATLVLDDAAARRVATEGDPWEVAEAAVDAALVACACEQAAAAAHLVSMSVGYAKERLQFGRPIGSFQAIQHRLADMHLFADRCRTAVEYATWAMAEGSGERREAASLAAVVCGEAFRTVAEETVQVHGGIGFTWEHPAHRYFRRAYASRGAYGAPAVHRERLLAAIGM